MQRHSQALLSRPGRRTLRQARDDFFLRCCRQALRGLEVGRLRITLPSGRSAVVFEGEVDAACNVHLMLKTYGAFWRALRRGGIGFASSYIDGQFEVNDLGNVFRFFLRNKAALTRAGRGWFRVRLPDKAVHRARANTRRGSRRNIAAHYDLGNAFYRQWLDDSMTYSSAIYRSDVPLEEAQAEKYARIVELLGLQAGTSVLEIGCGWGGMVEAAARAGADVTAITVSREQQRFAEARIARARLQHRADIRFADYRDVDGRYDRIVSIEMIEAVGEQNWQTYFDVLSRRLAPGGRAAIQAITIDPGLFPGYRRNPDFIQRYIFPGGMLPTEAAMQRCAEASGLVLSCVERFGNSYARTLAEWRSRFLDAWPQLSDMGFDQRFHRMWLYYLTYCEIGFEQGTTNVGIYQFSKPVA